MRARLRRYLFSPTALGVAIASSVLSLAQLSSVLLVSAVLRPAQVKQAPVELAIDEHALGADGLLHPVYAGDDGKHFILIGEERVAVERVEGHGRRSGAVRPYWRRVKDSSRANNLSYTGR
jgi:hypothetical protein